MTRGNFITFEGGDGVGKSTQIERLAKRLSGQGLECVVTREPGGTPFAERVRAFILEGELPPHSPISEAMLFAAARVDHIDQLIRPALNDGKWVLSDRFSDSTLAYQGAAGGADVNVLRQLEALAVGPHAPSLTIVLDLDPDTGKARIAARGTPSATATDPFEARDLEFQGRLRQAFLDIAKRQSGRCVVINAADTPDVVETHIWECVSRRYGLGGVQ